jgi:hypothetical protein
MGSGETKWTRSGAFSAHGGSFAEPRIHACVKSYAAAVGDWNIVTYAYISRKSAMSIMVLPSILLSLLTWRIKLETPRLRNERMTFQPR